MCSQNKNQSFQQLEQAPVHQTDHPKNNENYLQLQFTQVQPPHQDMFTITAPISQSTEFPNKPLEEDTFNSEPPPKKQKRTRTAFTSFQLLQLTKEFKNNTRLDRRRRYEIAQRLSLDEKQVKIWFQNKRANLRQFEQLQHVPVDKNDEDHSQMQTTQIEPYNSIPTGATSFSKLAEVNKNAVKKNKSAPESSLQKHKRIRTAFTSFQLVQLENEFERDPYPDRIRRYELAQILTLGEKQVKLWFQNRRAKSKMETNRDDVQSSIPFTQEPILQIAGKRSYHEAFSAENTATQENAQVCVISSPQGDAVDMNDLPQNISEEKLPPFSLYFANVPVNCNSYEVGEIVYTDEVSFLFNELVSSDP